MTPRASSSATPSHDDGPVHRAVIVLMFLPFVAVSLGFAAMNYQRENPPVVAAGQPLPDLVVTRTYAGTVAAERRDTAKIIVTNRGNAPARSLDVDIAIDEKMASIVTPKYGEGWNCSRPVQPTKQQARRRNQDRSDSNPHQTRCQSSVALQPGESRELLIDMIWNAKSTQHERFGMGVAVDARGRIVESDEKNNFSGGDIG